MDKKIYEVRIERGRSNPEHHIFHSNASNLNAKAPDFGGINNTCIISHHMDEKTVHMLCSSGMKDRNSVTIEEITKKTLDEKNGVHKIHIDLIRNYFLPHGNYPNIE